MYNYNTLHYNILRRLRHYQMKHLDHIRNGAKSRNLHWQIRPDFQDYSTTAIFY